MKSDKKGFTIIEIVLCIGILMIIAGIFAINFTSNLKKTKNEDFNQNKRTIEAAADAYVMTYKGSSDPAFSDIKRVAENEDTFTYITIPEIQDKGFLNDDFIDPETGNPMNGVVKFTQEKDGNYKFEYTEEAENYIVVIYEKNGATTISRSSQAFVCEDTSSKEKIASCVSDTTLPSITRTDADSIVGWSTDKHATSTGYRPSTSLANILRNGNYDINKREIVLYAITTTKRTLELRPSNGETGMPERVSCTLHNLEMACDVTLPTFTPPVHYNVKGWNTNIGIDGKEYSVNSSISLTRDLTLYAQSEIEDFTLLVNRLSRTSGTTVTPSNINIVLVLDSSGSMSSNSRLRNLKKVCLGLVDRMNLNNSTVSLIKFESSASQKLKFSQNITEIKNAINSLGASGGTSFNAAVSVTNSLLKNKPNDKETYIIFVSDGIANISASNTNLIELKTKAQIYSMGISAAADNTYLKIIASNEDNYYNYNDSFDDTMLSGFYDLFDDIVQNITILEGDGLQNAIRMNVQKGRLDLGNLVISDKYPIDIYLNEEKIDSFKETNEFLKIEAGRYYMDVLSYSLARPNVGIDNMKNLRIKFFFKEDE